MTVLFRMIILMASLLGLSACDENAHAPTTTDIVGHKVTILADSQEYYLTITKNQDNIVTSEATNWKQEFLYKNEYYRGLLLKSREKQGYHWELDIDFSDVDALFPLEVGAAVALKGSIVDLKEKSRLGYSAHLSVLAETPIMLPSGSYKAYQIKISQYYETKDGTKEWHQIVHYSPELNLNLKGVYEEGGEKKWWRITHIQTPDEGLTTPPTPPARQRRRAGTVMI